MSVHYCKMARYSLSSDGSQFTVSGPHRIGRIYGKVLYREFTDEAFTEEKPHPRYLGLLGPIIKGEVGDTLNVHFKNMANRSFTMHPHGVFYDKGSEGAFYDDHTEGDQKGDDHVPPGGTRVYKWTIPENHAPTKDDKNCLTWAYHSHVKPVNDINTGLIGEYSTAIFQTHSYPLRFKILFICFFTNIFIF